MKSVARRTIETFGERWRALLARARKAGRFVGVDPHAYPRDFAVFVRYYYDLLEKIKARYPLPPPLLLSNLDEFLGETQGWYEVQWSAHDAVKQQLDTGTFRTA